MAIAARQHARELAALAAATAAAGIVAGFVGNGATLGWLLSRRSAAKTRVVVLGLGYCGGEIAKRLVSEGCEVVGTTRGDVDAAKSHAGVRTLSLGSGETLKQLAQALLRADVVVVTAPPGAEGDPFLQEPELRSALETRGKGKCLVVYLSSVGVYGDQGGAEVTEETRPAPRTDRAKRRLAAEQAWQALPIQTLLIVRLPGIYGPNRGPLAKAREGNSRIVKEGHFFSRIHVKDLAQLCFILLQKFRSNDLSDLCGPGLPGIINCCDCDPAPQHEVTELAYKLLGRPVPPALPFDSAELSAMQRSFYEEDRYMVNKKLVAIMGSMLYPSYKTGLPACLEEEKRAAGGGFRVLQLLRQSALWAKARLTSAASHRSVLRVALVDNGSLKPEATLSLRRLAKALETKAEAAGLRLRVEAVSARFADRIPAHSLEGQPAEVLPSWMAKVAQQRSAGKVLLLPLLIGPSATITKTMPGAARTVEQLEVEIAPPLVCLCPVLMAPGASGAKEVARMLADRIADAGGPLASQGNRLAVSSNSVSGGADAGGTGGLEGPSLSGEPWQVLLCDHGSPTSIVAAARELVREELEKLLGVSVAGCCMERREGPEYDFNGPLLENALLGLPEGSRAVVALLFLQEGKHAGPGGDIANIILDVQQKRPDLSVTTTKVLAGHPGLIELLLQRVEKGVPVRLLH